MRKYRHEIKYVISKQMAEILKQRLLLIMDVDANSSNLDNTYLIRSLYFDDINNTAYYEKIDQTHQNWNKVSTAKMRLARYNEGRSYHKAWLREVLSMDPQNLSKNTIGLDAFQVKQMAKKLLEL